MSASRQKKLRKEQASAAPQTKRPAVSEEEKAAKRLKLWSIVFYIVIGLMVVGILVAAVFNSGLPQRMLTAVTVGNHKLSVAEMNYYFLDTVNSNSYLGYMVDNNTPLDEQEYGDGQTWADYLLETAVTSARDNYAIYDEAIANGYTLTEEDQAQIDQQIQTMETYASLYGYNSVSAFLRANYGAGCNESNYRAYLEVQAIATGYNNQIVEGLTYTQEEIDAEAAENPTDYTSYDYRYYLVSTSNYYETDADEHTEEETAAAKEAAQAAAQQLLDDSQGDGEKFWEAAHALMHVNDGEETTGETAPEETTGETEPAETTGETEPEETTGETEPEETTGETQPEETGDTTEEEDTHEDTTLYENTLKSSMPSILSDWLTDSARQAGDTTVIEASNDAGYYAVMFLGSNDNTEVPTVNVRHILISTSDSVTAEDARSQIEEIQAEYEEDPTEEHFAELAETYSSDTGPNTNGGLYENVAPGQMVEEFNDWIFADNRQAGDVGIVETDYGCHLMYFVGDGEYSYRDTLVVNALMQAEYDEWYTTLTEAMTTATGLGYGLVHTGVTVAAPSSAS